MNTKRLGPVSVAALALVCSSTLSANALAGQGASVGVVPNGQSAFEFVSRANQDGSNVTHFGYLTRLAGLNDSDLFSDPENRTEATARFTFVAQTSLSSRQELGNLIVTAAPGTATFYFHETPGADFDDPDSFADGQEVATFSMRFHNVLNVQKTDEGISSAAIELSQQTVGSFQLNDRPFRFGHKRSQLWLQANGQGTRTQVNPLEAFFLFGGTGVATQP